MNPANQKPAAARRHESHLREDAASDSEKSATSEGSRSLLSRSSDRPSSHNDEANACFSEDSDSFNDDYPGRKEKKSAVAAKKPAAKKLAAKKSNMKASKPTKAQMQRYLRFDSSDNGDEYAAK